MRLFVHIPKNGGMSIRRGIPDRIIVASAGNHVTPEYTSELGQVMAAAGEHHGNEHARWRDFRQDLRDQYRAAAIVRNPWARTVSRYMFAVNNDDKSGDKSFREFLDERHEYGNRPLFWHRAIRGWYPQVDYVTDVQGELRCDVLRFATSDVERYFGLNAPLPIRNISNTKGQDYRSFYGPDEHDIVADWYHRDIQFFGFTFDAGATRNVWTPTA